MNRLARATFLLAPVLSLLLCSASAVPNPKSEPLASFPGSCVFSCPPLDAEGQHSITLPGAAPYDSPYSIFECVWVPCLQRYDMIKELTWTNSVTGQQTLPSKVDNCVPRAVPCTKTDVGVPVDPEAQPRFSHLEYEVPSWVESARYILSLRQ
ncbi:hypothetical protein P691DRAFT_724988 [Macrolepiota fuliginosa MF-IS2]|uniref:Uncharacterized protein n=1 Tax=Macrolepiota fuliginosa MF-IS2 TaxID=1400762 RepID=A0A9P5XHW0_9AGAR|nr:hypothetical protein P691DRAFT_724988 [Macrolepiota fuliginosa MF-IS2]